MINEWIISMNYLWLALLGALGIALMAGPFGAFMVWRRLAYFGDTLAHSGLLGVTLALILHINVSVGICAVALCVALLLLGLQSRWLLASDTVLGLLSHALLALGLLLLAVFEAIQVDVLGFLYGDILAIGMQDLATIYGGGGLALLLLMRLWPSLLQITVHRELAEVEGVRVHHIEAAYLLLLALIVAIAIKLVGILLITGLLLIPAAAARPWSKTPEQMALFSSMIGASAVIVGMVGSHYKDLPTGPLIVVVAALFFVLSTAISSLYKLAPVK